MRFRFLVEQFLREALSDPDGTLSVDTAGPHWKGKEKLAGLSYSNTFSENEGWGVVVFSHTHAVGVDLEREKRVLKKPYLELAKRFFHESEYEALKKVSVLNGQREFLDLWMKKEAYSKSKRKHLLEFINQPIPSEVIIESLVKTRVGYRAMVAVI